MKGRLTLGGSSIRGQPLPIAQCNGVASKPSIITTILGGVPTILAMNDIEFDTTSGMSPISGIWTCQYSAHYNVSFFVNARKANTATNSLKVEILMRTNPLNPWVVKADAENYQAARSTNHDVCLTYSFYCKKGNQVAFRLDTSSLQVRVYPERAGCSIHSLGK